MRFLPMTGNSQDIFSFRAAGFKIRNNAIVLVNVTNASVIASFTAGTANLTDVDVIEDS